MKRRPSWACQEFERHGNVVCPECLRLYEAQGRHLERWDMLPPRATFGRGWFAVGATHWFEATDATVFPSRTGERLLAQAACGGICEVTMAWAPRNREPCRKCARVLEKANPPPPGQPSVRGASVGGESLRLYRGLTRPYDPTRVRRDRRSGTDFTNCPYTALGYATGPKGIVQVVDVAVGVRRVTEEFWFNDGAKRFMVWGAFDDLIVAAIPAKELRAQVRQRGIITSSDADKARVLRRYILDYLLRSGDPVQGRDTPLH
jgi:hypothetical protein